MGLRSRPDPTARFAEIVGRPDQLIPLDEAALLIAAHAQPGLDVAAELRAMDDLAAEIGEPTLEGWRRHLFVDLGFSGNLGRYYDPANSFLNEVMRRRRGLPITLSVLGMEIGRRVGLCLEGVGMPGHFLLHHAATEGPGIYVDPFDDGAMLDQAGCVRRFHAVNGAEEQFRPGYLEPIGRSAILSRILNNLLSIYSARGRMADMEWVLRLRAAFPGATSFERRDWARMLGATGRFADAATELEALIDVLPAHEGALRREAMAFRARLN